MHTDYVAILHDDQRLRLSRSHRERVIQTLTKEAHDREERRHMGKPGLMHERKTMIGRPRSIVAGIAALLLFVTGDGLAQGGWQWPEKPRNLQVLPKNWSGQQLSPVMRGFTRALGVRCSYCHKGEEGKDLSTYDFPSDENPNKARAREMIRMLDDINEHLKQIETSGETRLDVTCTTCHRGRPRPTTLEEELGEWYRANGVAAALAHYENLKEKFYGHGAFDFGEGSLNNFGNELLQDNDISGAIVVFSMNAKEFPKSPTVWESLGEAYWQKGDVEMARRNYSKSLKLNPANEKAKNMLHTISSAQKK